MDAKAPIQITVDEKRSGMRLDQFLCLFFPEISRSNISSSIKNKTIFVNANNKKSSYRLKLGDFVSGTIKEKDIDFDLLPQKIDFQILYEDEWLLVLSKPPGLVVHPGSGNPSGTLVNGLLYYYREIANVGNRALRPGIVHRLDKDTSGVMVVAKTDKTHKELVDLFKNHNLTKEYYALVQGVPMQSCGRIVSSIGRHPVHRQKMAVLDIGGKHAVTNWEIAERVNDQFTLLKISIETGRTHQIRVHMAYLGFPVAGDTLYGKSKIKDLFPRQMLHAFSLKFAHPHTKDLLEIDAPLWPDFLEVLSVLKE